MLNKFIFVLFFSEERYVCFYVIFNIIVGCMVKDFFVVYCCDDFVIIVFVDIIVNLKFFCIGEVWIFGSEFCFRMEIFVFIG